MKIFATAGVVAVIVGTVVGAFCVDQWAQVAVVGAAGFGLLLIALSFLTLTQIAAALKGKV
jgi:hypothetical protein